MNMGDGKKMMLFLLAGLLLLPACERRTAVALEGGSVPKFHLSGSGRLGEALIFDPAEEAIAKSDPFDKTHAIWDIVPQAGGENAAVPVQDLTVTYGVVPQGYKQVKPILGAALPSL